MAKITPPQDVRIPSLRQKPAELSDPMAGGAGTPWEDRGAEGLLRAFFATCFMSMRRPHVLLGSIRRPEGVRDATFFSLACGVMFSLGILLTGLLRLVWSLTRPNRLVDVGTFCAQYGALIVVVPFGVALLVRLGAQVLHKLASGSEMKVRSPMSLTVNVLAYCLGPSVLAVIPFVGAPLAIVWIVVLMVIGSRSRLRMSGTAAAVCSLITAAAVLVIVVVIWVLWAKLAWSDWVYIKPPAKPVQIRSR